ncbi:hypothetical protein AB0A76_33090 [Streptomyces exfoliatus]|uniref:Uncharacterized protein n=1 Tax=Streptomyces exfoliatus TaxID=1905 RepID=A0ABV3D671_STREX
MRRVPRLRTENGQLRQQARAHLGQPVEQLGNHDLVDRVNELAEENRRLSTAERPATAKYTELQQRVAELEDDLAAARTSLRRMIRNENVPSDLDGTNSGGGVPDPVRAGDGEDPPLMVLWSALTGSAPNNALQAVAATLVQ